MYVCPLTAYFIKTSLTCVPDNANERHPPFLFRFSAPLVYTLVHELTSYVS